MPILLDGPKTRGRRLETPWAEVNVDLWRIDDPVEACRVHPSAGLAARSDQFGTDVEETLNGRTREPAYVKTERWSGRLH